MNDWKMMAQARGLKIPEGESDRVLNPLRSLEAVLRPLLSGLPPGLDPATKFDADPETGA